MTKLTPVKLDDGTVIYIEATEDVDAPLVIPEETAGGEERGRDNYGVSDDLQKQALQSFTAVESTIRAYTTNILNAFKQVKDANIDKVTLEFGIKVGAEASVPYITKGTAESNLKITVECSFPKEGDNKELQIEK